MSECQHCKGYTPKIPFTDPDGWVFCDECAEVAAVGDGEWDKRTDLYLPKYPEETESW